MTIPCQTPTAAPPTSARRSSAVPRLTLARWPTCGAWGSCCTPCWLAATPSTTPTQPLCFPKSAEASAVCQRACRLRPNVCSRACWGENPRRDLPRPSCSLTRGSTSRRRRRKWRWVNRKRARQNRWCRPLTRRTMMICSADGLDSAESGWGTKSKPATRDFFVRLFLHWHFLEPHLCTVECTYTLKLSTKHTVLYFLVVVVVYVCVTC